MSFVSGDELIGDVIQVIADDLRLRAHPQNIVADPLDQRCFPAGRHGTERVPCMAGDKTELGGLNPKLPLDVGVSLARRLMVLHAVRAEAALEKIDDTAVLELTGLHLEQIVREREQPETCIAQFAERCRHLGVRRHRRKLLREFFLISVRNFDAPRIRQHLHHSRTDIRERNVAAGDRQRRRIHNEVGEPKAHGLSFAEDALEDWLHCLQIEQRFIDVEDDQRKSSHVMRLRFANSMLEDAFVLHAGRPISP